MSDLVAFLRARLAEEGATAHRALKDTMAFMLWGSPDGSDDGSPFGGPAMLHVTTWGPRRVLAEVAAKEAILNLHERWSVYVPVTVGSRQAGKMNALIDAAAHNALEKVLLAMVQPYAVHPEFDPAWKSTDY